VTAALIVFVLTYMVIASRQLTILKLDRPSGALVGAVAMVAVGGLGADAALDAIDLHVLTLLLGVLLIAAYLEEAKFFRYVSYLVLTRAGSARTLLWGLTFVSGALSAFLVNDTVCIVLTPLVVMVAIEARLPVMPYLLALAGATNLGGVVSFSGNPQNMLIGRAADGHPSFAQYLAVTLPVGVACLAANAATLTWLFRRELPRGPVGDRSPPRPGIDRLLAGKGLLALAAFAIAALAGVPLAGAAIAAAAGLIVVARIEPRRALVLVDWQVLLFFAGLFVVVQGLRGTGLLADALEAVGPVIHRGDALGDAAFVGITVVGSNLVSNVPFVMLAADSVPAMPDPTWGWIMLAVASTLAGNLTLMGSVANVLVMEAAGPRGEIGFFRFLRYGAVMTTVSLVVAFAILWAERELGFFTLVGL
jgi:Na+/H+ antiporter NhaD/arsenite permease-like protein